MKIDIRWDGNYCHLVSRLPYDHYKGFSDVLSYHIEGAEFSEAYQSGNWDGKKRLLKNNGAFPAGLMCIAYPYLSAVGHVSIIDTSTNRFGGVEYTLDPNIDFRYYQKEAIDAFVSSDLRTGIFCIATGGGKTITAAGVIARLGLPTLFVANGLESMRQIGNTFKDVLGVSPTFVGGGSKEVSNFTIGIRESLLKIPYSEFSHVGLVVVDECHRLGSDSLYTYLMKIVPRYKLGLSGTPFRNDGKDLQIYAYLGGVVYTKTAVELAKEGFLLRASVTFYEINSPKDIKGLSYQNAYIAGIEKNEYRNKVIVENVVKRIDKAVLVIVEKIDHGELLKNQLRDVGVSVEFVNGTLKEERKEYFNRFSTGELRCLIATRIYDEAVDIPIVDTVILAAGGKSKIKFVQRVGRVLRKHGGQVVGNVIDFIDNTNRYLKRHSEARFDICSEYGYDVIRIGGDIDSTKSRRKAGGLEVYSAPSNAPRLSIR